MKTTIIIGILAVCLLVSTGWGVIIQNRVQVQKQVISELQGTITLKEEANNQLREENGKLRVEYTQLNQEYTQLSEDNTELNRDYDKLNQDYAQSQRDVVKLQAEVENWENKYERLTVTHESDLDNAKFMFYYTRLKQRYGVDDLEEYLDRWEWTEGTYKANEFDCSQMSAYVERRLENEGYNTVIVAGDNPSGDGKHAWLLVETSEGKYIPVEATTISIVYWQNPYFDKYFEYDYEFETIHEALDSNPIEFTWWN